MSSTDINNRNCDKCGRKAIQSTIVGDETTYFCGTWECIQDKYPVDKYPMVNKFMCMIKCEHEEMLDKIKEIMNSYKLNSLTYTIQCPYCQADLLLGIGGGVIGCSTIGCKNDDKEEKKDWF